MNHPVALHPVTLAFRDRALEARFGESLGANAVRRTRSTFLLGVIAWCAFGAWDLIVLPSHFGTLALIRYGIGLPVLLAPIALTFAVPRARFEQIWEWVSAVAAAIACLLVVAMQAAIGEAITPYAYVALAMTVVFTHTLILFRSLHAAASSVVAIAAYLLLIGWVDAVGFMRFTNNSVWLVTALVFAVVTSRELELLRRVDWYQGLLVERERARSEALLLNILPEPIAARLKNGEEVIADAVDSVTVMFADIAGFTPLADRLSPTEVVAMLNGIFSRFDEIAGRLGLEKIKTIGDAYMVVGGLAHPGEDQSGAIAEMALEMCAEVERIAVPDGSGLRMRIGIHCGSVVAGVIGKRKYSYDVWGDTVNTASRMESHGIAGRVHVSDEARRRLDARFSFEDRGMIDIKGKGPMRTWLLVGETGAA